MKKKKLMVEDARSVPTEDFMDAIVESFGELTFDLCAVEGHAQADEFWTLAENPLKHDWSPLRGNLWLLAPRENLEKWVAKSLTMAPYGQSLRRIFLVSPYDGLRADEVRGNVLVIALRPRLTLVDGTKVEDFRSFLYVFGETPRGDDWRWKSHEDEAYGE